MVFFMDITKNPFVVNVFPQSGKKNSSSLAPSGRIRNRRGALSQALLGLKYAKSSSPNWPRNPRSFSTPGLIPAGDEEVRSSKPITFFLFVESTSHHRRPLVGRRESFRCCVHISGEKYNMRACAERCLLYEVTRNLPVRRRSPDSMRTMHYQRSVNAMCKELGKRRWFHSWLIMGNNKYQ